MTEHKQTEIVMAVYYYYYYYYYYYLKAENVESVNLCHINSRAHRRYGAATSRC